MTTLSSVTHFYARFFLFKCAINDSLIIIIVIIIIIIKIIIIIIPVCLNARLH